MKRVSVETYQVPLDEHPPLSAEPKSHDRVVAPVLDRASVNVTAFASRLDVTITLYEFTLDETASRVLDLVCDPIRIAGFWKKPEEIRRMRAEIKTELMTCGITNVEERSERIAIELTKLAEKRHDELLRT